LTPEQRIEKVDSILTKLRLIETKHKRITLLSGGEKKRLSIVEELLSEKELLFLDEPTSGLDSFMADQVVEVIHDISSKSNKTVIYTIHQPSYTIYDRFTNILLLNKGRIFYLGPAKDLQQHCTNLKIEIPEFANPAE